MRGTAGRGAIAVTLAAAAAALGAASASAKVGLADRAATHAYLQAQYEYEQALLAAQPARTAAVEAAASQIGSECAGVLAGAPQPRSFSRPPLAAPDPRREGEENRLEMQASALESELNVALTFTASRLTETAKSTLAGKLRVLRWSDRRLTLLVHYAARLFEQRPFTAQPPVCSDMRAWVTSGYKLLAPATRSLVEGQKADFTQLVLLYAPELLLSGMARFRGPAEDALSRRLNALRKRVTGARSPEPAAYERVRGAIGLPSREDEHETSVGKPRPPFEIGHAKTAGGGRFSVWLRTGGGSGGCRTGVEVRQEQLERAFECLPGFGPQRPTVKCLSGLLTVDLVTGGKARSVEMRLSDGTRITSRPIRIPKRFGGPAGIYYQQVRGPGPVPLALVELGARGRRLRELKLEPLEGCTKHPFKYLPGGFRVLAHGREPRGPLYAIVAEHYRLYGVTHFKLRFAEGVQPDELRRTSEPEGLFGQSFEEGGEEGESGRVEAVPGHPGRFAPPPFQPNVESGCHPYEHSLVYGLLKSLRDRVFVKVAGVTRQLRRVPIPAGMHAGSQALVYGAFSSAPEAVIVRGPGGRVLQREDDRTQAKNRSETCEGEAEGSGPTAGEDNGGYVFFGEAL